jgi:starch synthase
MDVLMACAEVAPIVKVGALGDAVAALAKTLSRLDHKVTAVIPRYPAIEEAGHMLARRLTPLRFDVAGETVEATIFDGRLAPGVDLVVLDLPGALDEPGVYGTPQDAKRFGYFARAVCELVKKRAAEGSPFDVVHAHDWSTALVPFLLAKLEAPRPRTVLTIHDATRQGRFPKEAVDTIGLSWDDFHPEGLEFFGDLNMLKAGIVGADVVAAVSQSYAEELAAPGGASGLDGVLRGRGEPIAGVMNGVDYALWSPATDPHIASRYDSEDVGNKGRCKAALMKELDLAIDPDRPLLVFLGPLDEDHGADLVVDALDDILKTRAQVVIAGTGDDGLVAALEEATTDAEAGAAYVGAPSEPMRHRLVSAADAVLLPSRREPGGVMQQVAQRYGAPPIALSAEGASDNIVDCDSKLETGTGFVFDEPTADAVIGAVQRAISAMGRPTWGALRRRIMRLDVSWERPARRYARLYQPR